MGPALVIFSLHPSGAAIDGDTLEDYAIHVLFCQLTFSAKLVVLVVTFQACNLGNHSLFETREHHMYLTLVCVFAQ